MSDKASITPEVLKWARTTANISPEKAAHSMGATVERLKSWEDGIEQPTLKQAEKLAHLYRRPFAVLFLPSVPTDFKPLQDFRSKNRGEFSTALIFMMREIQEKQLWASSMFEENGEDPLSFVGKFSRRVSPETVASDIRRTLGISTREYEVKGALRYWIQRVEAARIYVSLSSNFHSHLKLDSDEVKGFAIADRYAPFIFLNSDDYENPKLFTLVHELAHIWINQSGISTDTQVVNFRETHTADIDPVEVYCNQVAANALLPKEELESAGRSINTGTFKELESLSKRFGVSTLTLLFRLYDLGMITQRQFGGWKKEADLRFAEYEAKLAAASPKKSGGPNYYLLQLIRNGRAFSQLVMDFYKGGQITGVEASHLLKVKLNKFSAFENQLYR